MTASALEAYDTELARAASGAPAGCSVRYADGRHEPVDLHSWCGTRDGSVFSRLPGEGRWQTVLLADGNIGIGGNPSTLLGRAAELVTDEGRVLVELDHEGSGRTAVVRFETDRGTTSGWFRWAHLGPAALPGVAAAAGLTVRHVWRSHSRCFAELARG